MYKVYNQRAQKHEKFILFKTILSFKISESTP